MAGAADCYSINVDRLKPKEVFDLAMGIIERFAENPDPPRGHLSTKELGLIKDVPTDLFSEDTLKIDGSTGSSDDFKRIVYTKWPAIRNFHFGTDIVKLGAEKIELYKSIFGFVSDDGKRVERTGLSLHLEHDLEPSRAMGLIERVLGILKQRRMLLISDSDMRAIPSLLGIDSTKLSGPGFKLRAAGIEYPLEFTIFFEPPDIYRLFVADDIVSPAIDKRYGLFHFSVECRPEIVPEIAGITKDNDAKVKIDIKCDDPAALGRLMQVLEAYPTSHFRIYWYAPTWKDLGWGDLNNLDVSLDGGRKAQMNIDIDSRFGRLETEKFVQSMQQQLGREIIFSHTEID